MQPVLQDAGGGAKPQQEVVWKGVEIRARRAAGPRCPRNEPCKETSSGGEQSHGDTTPLLPRYVRKRHRASRSCGFGGRSTVSLSVGKRGLASPTPQPRAQPFLGSELRHYFCPPKALLGEDGCHCSANPLPTTTSALVWAISQNPGLAVLRLKGLKSTGAGGGLVFVLSVTSARGRLPVGLEWAYSQGATGGV